MCKVSMLFTPLPAVLVLCAGCNTKPRITAKHELPLYKIPSEPGSLQAGPSIPVSITSDVLVVNMIPPPYSYETNQDSEPNISVSAIHTDHLVASAFTPGPFDRQSKFCSDSLSPLFMSSDEGNSWTLICAIPTYPSTFDITVRYGPRSDDVYAAILLNGSNQMEILRTPGALSAGPMQTILKRAPFDQPYIETAEMSGEEAVFVGENNCCGMPAAVGGKSASIDLSLNPDSARPTFTKSVLEQRDVYENDLASIRIAAHEPDDTVYAVFSGLTGVTQDASTYLASLTVVRDDRGGTSSPAFQALKDHDDSKVGQVIARDIRMPEGNLGNQRLASQSHCSIAVDPRPISNYPIYVAWVDSGTTGVATLHLVASMDKGAHWYPRSIGGNGGSTIPNATNPALAVNEDGVVALMYQQLTSGEWGTHILISADGFGTEADLVLSQFPESEDAFQFDPFLGDYIHLLSKGKDFYGIFSASNKPDYSHFPFTTTYGKDHLVFQRDVNFDLAVLLDRANSIATVKPSIDPYFVKISLKKPEKR